MRETGVDGVTVARGAIGNPWIFQQGRALAAGDPLPLPPTTHEQREVIEEHLRLVVDLYGEDRAITQFRKFGVKYSFLHPQMEELRQKFVRIKELADWHAIRDAYYLEDQPGKYLSAEIHNGQVNCSAG